jgi:hypothetical protein
MILHGPECNYQKIFLASLQMAVKYSAYSKEMEGVKIQGQATSSVAWHPC